MRFWHISGACFVAHDGTMTFKAQQILAAATVFGIERLYTLVRNVDMLGRYTFCAHAPSGMIWVERIQFDKYTFSQHAAKRPALKLHETPPRHNHSYETCFVGNVVSSNIERGTLQTPYAQGRWAIGTCMCLQIMFVLPTDVMIQRQVQLSICIDGRWIVIF